MKAASIYVWRGKAYVPVSAQYESGIFVGIEPVYTANLSAVELLAAVKKALAAGHPCLPTPTREEMRQRKDPVLAATKARSWKELARTGAAYTINWTDKEVRVDMSRLDKKGRWEYDPEKMRTFPPETPLKEIIAVILDDIRSRPGMWLVPSASVKMLRWHLQCHDCRYSGIVYVIAGDGYGRFIGRTSMGELVFLDTFNPVEGEVFAEVCKIVGEAPGLDNTHRVHRALSVVCDPAPSGELYDFTSKFRCPACGSRDVRYGPGATPEAEIMEVYLVTHDSWLRLSDEEKKERISSFLQGDDSCPVLNW